MLCLNVTHISNSANAE